MSSQCERNNLIVKLRSEPRTEPRSTRGAWIIGSAGRADRPQCPGSGPRFTACWFGMPLRQEDLDEITGRGGQGAIAGQQRSVQGLCQGDIMSVIDGHGMTHRPDAA